VDRRAFIAGTLGLLAAPRVAQAQPPDRVFLIGVLGHSSASAYAGRTKAFRQGLRDLGYVEGKNIELEYRWSEGKQDRLAVLATELVRRKVDVIVTHSVGVLAAKHATTSIPIVMAIAGDPVGTGLVASLARPGGNVTGLSLGTEEGLYVLSRRAASPCERDHAKRRAEKLLYMRLETRGLKGYIATSQGEPVGEQEG
jgi:putative ABC transport system substrate-binding protein